MLTAVDVRYPVTQGLCLAPTREIAQHIFAEFCTLTTRLPDIRITLAIPGNDLQVCDAHLVIGTPGTVGVSRFLCYKHFIILLIPVAACCVALFYL
jgi:superfamily II DNA/RNA helicase